MILLRLRRGGLDHD